MPMCDSNPAPTVTDPEDQGFSSEPSELHEDDDEAMLCRESSSARLLASQTDPCGRRCLAASVTSVSAILLLAVVVVARQVDYRHFLGAVSSESVSMWEFEGVELKSGDNVLDIVFNETLAECLEPVKNMPAKRGGCFDALYSRMYSCRDLRLKDSPPATCDRLRRCLKGEFHSLVDPCSWFCRGGSLDQMALKVDCLNALKQANEWGAKCNEKGYQQKEFEYLEKVNDLSHECMIKTTTTTTTPGRLLYCWVLVVPWTGEPDLLLLHQQLEAGILSCDGFDVFSDRKMRIGSLDTIEISDLDLHCKINPQTRTVENTHIFRKAWKKVLDKLTWEQYEWTVKVDLDAVFFPDRLGVLLKDAWIRSHAQIGNGVWLNNCWRGLHGPIEVLSMRAMQVYHQHWAECASVAATRPQEDVYLGSCMHHLRVHRHDAWSLLAEDHCDQPKYKECSGNWISYHPFKETDEWKGCYDRALGL